MKAANVWNSTVEMAGWLLTCRVIFNYQAWRHFNNTNTLMLTVKVNETFFFTLEYRTLLNGLAGTFSSISCTHAIRLNWENELLKHISLWRGKSTSSPWSRRHNCYPAVIFHTANFSYRVMSFFFTALLILPELQLSQKLLLLWVNGWSFSAFFFFLIYIEWISQYFL